MNVDDNDCTTNNEKVKVKVYDYWEKINKKNIPASRLVLDIQTRNNKNKGIQSNRNLKSRHKSATNSVNAILKGDNKRKTMSKGKRVNFLEIYFHCKKFFCLR